ncbi:UNVERIFIED_CONTAM: Retrovirus-related Pol polyprotein from transposon RE2 [Sesamum angustifolium]|uniref:Retrovirus-related Pol polyprotein from transposon RE2 n=1 Tax=Sesamum angustifolium TaxID=2727405 RepID=A0AAW2MAX3_9LAMI
MEDLGNNSEGKMKKDCPLIFSLQKLSANHYSTEGSTRQSYLYMGRLVGRLLYLGFTRPDISFATQQLSQFLQHPRSSHWDAALHVLRYLKGTSSLGLFFSAQNSLQPTVYTDASWASCPESRRSITGFCIFLGSSLVSWKTKRQSTVSRSSAEAEYRSMGAVVCELLWLSYLLHALHIPFSTPVPFWCDNQAAIHITPTPFSMNARNTLYRLSFGS